ncbi:MAG: YceI family protein [Bdellovibrionales bacterium]|nr:YceI family protein [Bdellovibrionales bacterium]
MKYFFCSLIFLSSIAFSKEINLELLKDKTSVEFEAKGTPSILTIKGQKARGSGQLKLTDGLMSGDVIVELNDFDTDIDTRNEHMKEKYLETGKPGFNISKLKLSSVPFSKDFPDKIKKVEGQIIEGLLTLHGIEKKVSGILTMNSNAKDEVAGNITFKIKLSDFGIEIPSFAGITVADEVAVKSDYIAKVVDKKQ